MQTENLDHTTDDAADAPDQMSPDTVSEDVSVTQDNTPGAVLKAERLRRNLSEKDISDKLHITMHYVRAIEANRFDKLPGAVFAKGYIKSYALYLELDVDAVTSLFEGINSQQEELKVEANRRLMAQRRSDRNKPWVYASVATFVIGFVGLWAYSQYAGGDTATTAATSAPASSSVATPAPAPVVHSPAVNAVTTNARSLASDLNTATLVADATDVTENQQEQTVSPASNDPARSEVDSEIDSEIESDIVNPASSQPSVSREPDLIAALSALSAGSPQASSTSKPVSDNVISVGAEGGDVLRIHFSGESWVEVNDKSEQQVYRDIREAGDILEIKGEAPFSILLGDAPFAKMYLNGTEIDVSDDIRIDNSARLTVGL